jgi:hypothetical protein
MRTPWRRRLAELDGLCDPGAAGRRRSRRAPSSHDSGTSYLVAEAADLQRREATVVEIRELVRDWMREIKVLGSQEGVRIAAWSPMPDGLRLKDPVQGWQAARSGSEAVVSGPWPAFSLVGDNGSAAP